MSEKLNYFTAIKFLSKYISKYKKNFLMFYFGWFFDSILSVIMPILFGIMVDEIVYYQNVSIFLKIALSYLVLTIFSCCLLFLNYFQYGYLSNMYTYEIRKDIFNHFHKKKAQDLSNTSAGDIIATLQSYSGECMHFVIRNIIHITNDTLVMFAYAGYLLNIDWRIGLFAICAAPISTFVSAKFGKKIRNYGDEQRKYYSGYVSWLFEILSSLRDIRMLGAKEKIEDLFKKNHNDMFSVNIKSSISSISSSNIITFTNLAIQLCIFTITGYAAKSGNITVGLLIIIVGFYGSLIRKINSVSQSYLDAQNRISYIQRIYDFMQSPTEDEWKGKNHISIPNGSVEFNNITFAYKGQESIIKNFNLNILPGERLALVGKSGCGKTTIAYMLIGFYTPQEGNIFIEGEPIINYSLKSIRQNIGLIQQDVLIFDGTIRENILLGKLKSTEEELINACRGAGLCDFIESLPQGLDTIIGSKGIGISGGQKQRIAIARIYLKKPQIIIFDEATSSLDGKTEEAIHEAWQEVLKGQTAIIIAHRQSSVMLCDRVAIIENGCIAEIGTPIDMIKNSERFKALFAVKEGTTND